MLKHINAREHRDWHVSLVRRALTASTVYPRVGASSEPPCIAPAWPWHKGETSGTGAAAGCRLQASWQGAEGLLAACRAPREPPSCWAVGKLWVQGKGALLGELGEPWLWLPSLLEELDVDPAELTLEAVFAADV